MNKFEDEIVYIEGNKYIKTINRFNYSSCAICNMFKSCVKMTSIHKYLYLGECSIFLNRIRSYYIYD